VDPRGGKLTVNEDEAQRVRAIFDLYLEQRSLIAVVREINRRGWTTKVWVTKDGREHPGKPFTKSSLFRLLTNVIYTGQVNHKGTYYPGEHPAVVDAAVWAKADQRLRHNGVTGGKEVRNKYGALLRGVLHCDACGTAMVHTYTVKGSRRYRYYVCLTAQQQGWDACPSKSLPAQRVEDSIVDRIRSLGNDPRIAAETARKVRQQAEASLQELGAELKTAEKELNRLQRELVKVAATPGGNGMRTDRMADLQDRIHTTERRVAEVRGELDVLGAEAVSQPELKRALEAFDPVWKSLNSSEQARIVRALVDRVGYHGRTGKIAVTFRAAGFKDLCEMVSDEQ
jgi:site-specific DNA recombinase